MPLARQLSPRLALAVRLTGWLSLAGAVLYFAFQVRRPDGAVWDGIDLGLYYGLLALARCCASRAER